MSTQGLLTSGEKLYSLGIPKECDLKPKAYYNMTVTKAQTVIRKSSDGTIVDIFPRSVGEKVLENYNNQLNPA